MKSIKTSVESPNMNVIAERFVCSIGQEVLDFYILINEKQFQKILNEYINYYNSKRPHQGLDQRIPKKYKTHRYGKVQKLPILGGFHHHYFRSAA
jgi:transposase InsO family protein